MGRKMKEESSKFGSWVINKIIEANESDGYFELIIYGKRGIGKSIYAYKVAKKIYQSKEELWGSWVYSINQLIDKLEDASQKEERIKLLIWDDAGVHAGKYKWFSDEQITAIALTEVWQTIRDTVASLIITTPSLQMLLKGIRSLDTYVGKVVWANKKYRVVMLKIYQQNVTPSGFVYPKLVTYELYKAWLPDDEYLDLKSRRKKYTANAIQKLREIQARRR